MIISWILLCCCVADSLNLNQFPIIKLAEKPKLNQFSGLTEVAQTDMLVYGGE